MHTPYGQDVMPGVARYLPLRHSSNPGHTYVDAFFFFFSFCLPGGLTIPERLLVLSSGAMR